MSRLQEYLDSKKLDPRRLVATSKRLESLTAQDRSIREAKRRLRGGKATDAEKELATSKPRSGKPVSKPLLARALAGQPVSAAAKTRILRAVNGVLETKMAGTAELKDLFG